MKRNGGFDGGAATVARSQAGRATEAFLAGYAAAETTAKDLMARNLTVAEMRELGGWTAILLRAFRQAAGAATVPWLFGTTIAVEALFTTADIADIKIRAQRDAK